MESQQLSQHSPISQNETLKYHLLVVFMLLECIIICGVRRWHKD